MSVAAIGAILGLLLAVADIVLLRLLAARVDLAETKLALKVTGLVQLVLLPAMGWFVAPLIAGE
ncbi:MAG: hypothetical protein J0H53_23350 [Rhizobiales bacterium]|jgi:hypothetical protein|nr:hypothetical protein [Hyphomicrobiales bacterium]OJU30729.1 MAG: NADH dehydrogenase [Rhizobiales bacterium 68-8]